WSHSTKTLKGHWKLEFAPNPDYLPGGPKASDPSAPYKNITSDIAIDPKDPGKVVLAVGWRGGDTYNGFYAKSGGSWQRLTGAGYQPGIQSWYDQFLTVDPKNPDHVYAGLEEVFETKDGGKSWSVPGPYWNFGFPCWSIDPTKQTGDCHQTVHADQHSVAIG